MREDIDKRLPDFSKYVDPQKVEGTEFSGFSGPCCEGSEVLGESSEVEAFGGLDLQNLPSLKAPTTQGQTTSLQRPTPTSSSAGDPGILAFRASVCGLKHGRV